MLRRTPKGCEFTYTEAFLRSNEPRIAHNLPKTSEPLIVEGIANLPTYFAGLLPEGVMFTAIQRLLGAAQDDLFAILAATGVDAIGDIDVRVPGAIPQVSGLSLKQAAELIESLTRHQSVDLELLRTVPGAQRKLSIGEVARSGVRRAHIAKFPAPEFPGLLQNEYAIMRLAKRCGLEVPAVGLEPEALIVTRFDRVLDASKVQFKRVHVEDLLQIMDLFPNSKYSMEYIALLEAMDRLGTSKASILQALQLYVFSVVVGNGDLHAKNVSLIHRDSQWTLSPCYDLLTTLPYDSVIPGADRMALALCDETFGNFMMEDFITAGGRFGIPQKAIVTMVSRTANKVLKHINATASGYLDTDILNQIQQRAEAILTS